MKRKKISKALIESVFKYDEKTSKLVRVSGGSVGYLNKNTGYCEAKIGNEIYSLHRLIWTLFNGSTEKMIDHINGIKTDNRIENLREATRSENAANSKKQSNNNSGFKGVSLNGGRYYARITSKGVHYGLGSSQDPIIAAQMYDAGASLHFGEFAKTNKRLGLI